MSFKDYKKGLTPIEDQAIENRRETRSGFKFPFSWKNRGSWHELPPRRHPGWAASRFARPTFRPLWAVGLEGLGNP